MVHYPLFFIGVFALWMTASGGIARAQDPDEASELREAVDWTQPADVLVGFGPFVGGGRTDAGGRVRHASGYNLVIERPFVLGPLGFSIGPRIELCNSFINTKDKIAGNSLIATYDSRLLGAGIIASKTMGSTMTLAQRLYFAAMTGKAYTKISMDESNDKIYRQSELDNVNGHWFQGELGAFMPLKGSLGVSLALLGNRLTVDQASARGTYEGDAIADDGSLTLISGNVDNARDKKLSDRAAFDTLGLRLGLMIGF